MNGFFLTRDGLHRRVEPYMLADRLAFLVEPLGVYIQDTDCLVDELWDFTLARVVGDELRCSKDDVTRIVESASGYRRGLNTDVWPRIACGVSNFLAKKGVSLAAGALFSELANNSREIVGLSDVKPRLWVEQWFRSLNDRQIMHGLQSSAHQRVTKSLISKWGVSIEDGPLFGGDVAMYLEIPYKPYGFVWRYTAETFEYAHYGLQILFVLVERNPVSLLLALQALRRAGNFAVGIATYETDAEYLCVARTLADYLNKFAMQPQICGHIYLADLREGFPKIFAEIMG